MFERIDQLFPEHEFGVVVENRSLQLASGDALEKFLGAFERIRLPWLRSIFRNASSPSLQNYLHSPYRRELLEDVPIDFLGRATQILLGFKNISGEGAAPLAALWRFAENWRGGNDRLQDAVREEQGRVVIGEYLSSVLSREEAPPDAGDARARGCWKSAALGSKGSSDHVE
jgi:hypothetical protein